MDLTPAALLFGLATGTLGLAAVQYGRKMADPRRIGLGVGLMVLPFVLDGAAGWAVSAAMTALLFWP